MQVVRVVVDHADPLVIREAEGLARTALDGLENLSGWVLTGLEGEHQVNGGLAGATV